MLSISGKSRKNMPQNVNNLVGWTLTRPRGAELTKNLL